jgi:hypothetical protein
MVAGNEESKIHHGGRFDRQMATTSKDKMRFAERAGYPKSKRWANPRACGEGDPP